jgi:MFS superfamily sulfate permease-like transporter
MVRLARINPIEFWIAAVTAAIGLAAGLIPAVAAGVVFTLVLVLRELNRPRISVSSPVPGVLLVKLESPLYTANVLGTAGAVLAAVDAGAMGASGAGAATAVSGAVAGGAVAVSAAGGAADEEGGAASGVGGAAAGVGASVVVLDASVIQVTSVTVVDALTDLDRELAEKGVRLEIAALPQGALVLARKTSWWRGLESAGRVHPSVDAALALRR